MIKIFVWDNKHTEWYNMWFKEEKISSLFKENGVELVFDDPDYKCDGMIGDWCEWKTEEYEKWKSFPYKAKFIMESHDGTFPKKTPYALKDNSIKAIFKHDIFRDFKSFAKDYPFYINAGHFELIAREYPELRNEKYIRDDTYIVYNDEEIEKINNLICLGCPLLFQPPYLLKKKFSRVKEEDIINTNRPTDVFFSATIDYRNEWFLSFCRVHRNGYYDILKELSSEFNMVVGCERENKVNGKDYVEQALKSKIMVSPYGIGSFAYRDWEVLLFGCEGIRPYTEYMKTYPDIYDPELKAFYQPKNNRDINEIREAIRYLLSIYDKPDSIERRLYRFRLLRDTAEKPEFLIKGMCDKIKSEIEK